MVEWVNTHGDYVFLGGGKASSTAADVVIVYEKLEDHDRDGMNMLYADGHVEFQARDNAMREIERSGGTPPEPASPIGTPRRRSR
jgi:prepilin-type processing-associated H-X9-DG protein